MRRLSSIHQNDPGLLAYRLSDCRVPSRSQSQVYCPSTSRGCCLAVCVPRCLVGGRGLLAQCNPDLVMSDWMCWRVSHGRDPGPLPQRFFVWSGFREGRVSVDCFERSFVLTCHKGSGARGVVSPKAFLGWPVGRGHNSVVTPYLMRRYFGGQGVTFIRAFHPILLDEGN